LAAMATKVAFEVYRRTGTLPLEWVTAQRVHNSWRKPRFSPQRLQAVKRMVVGAGLEWKDPRPVREPKERHPLARVGPKGHAHMNAKEAREKHIAAQLQKMPKLIQKYREAVLARKATKFRPISLLYKGQITKIRQVTNKERYKMMKKKQA